MTTTTTTTTNEQQEVPDFSRKSPEIDWKQRYEQSQNEHQLELERIRLHYEHELREKVTEIRLRLKSEYDQQFTEFRERLLEQYQQQMQNLTSNNSLNLDQSIGEQIREQLRIAQEFERFEDEQRQQLQSQQSIDGDELKRLVNKLHTEGIHVLSLSELLSLRLNGINLSTTDASIESLQKLHEENSALRLLISNINSNADGNTLIKSLAEIFRCEQERRLIDVREHKNASKLEKDIYHMCDYQRNALSKLLSQDRLLLINELDQTKEQLIYLKDQLEHLKQNQNQPSIINNTQQLNRFYFKYLRCEAYRKALIYQKRYLLILLTGYEDTETYALNEIRRLTGDVRPYSLNYDKKVKPMLKSKFQRRSSNYRFRFRCYATVVIGMIRMRWLVRKWAHKLATVR